MADLPSDTSSNTSSNKVRAAKATTGFFRRSPGPALLTTAVVLFVVTRIVVWLPLSILGTWINGFLYPVIVVSALAGGFLSWRRMQRNG